jgi:hypothetical protein
MEAHGRRACQTRRRCRRARHRPGSLTRSIQIQPHLTLYLTFHVDPSPLSLSSQVVKAATSHKVASLGLLSDASEVMVKLEDVVYNTALSVSEREQLIHRVGHRLLLAMDRAEGVVRKFGHVSAMRKMFQSSEAALGHFEDVAQDIGKVSLVADAGGLASMKMMMMSTSEAVLSSAVNGVSHGFGGASVRQASHGMSLDGIVSGSSSRASTTGIGTAAGKGRRQGWSRRVAVSAGSLACRRWRNRAAAAVAAAQPPLTENDAPYAMGRADTVSGMQTRMSFNPPTALNLHSASTALSKTDGVSIVTDFTSMELFKGSKQAFLEAGTLVCWQPVFLSRTWPPFRSSLTRRTLKHQARAWSWRRPRRMLTAPLWDRSCGSTRPRSSGRTG